MPARFYSGNIKTPIGVLIVIVNDQGAVMRLDFENDTRAHSANTRIAITHHDDAAVNHVT